MSNDELKSLPSLRGYLNFDELRSVILKSFGAGSVTALALTLLTVVLDNAGSIYVGPGAPIVISIAATIAAVIKANQVGVKYLKEGEEI